MRWMGVALCLAIAVAPRAANAESFEEIRLRLVKFKDQPPVDKEWIAWTAKQLTGAQLHREPAIDALEAIGERAWKYAVKHLHRKQRIETRIAAATALDRIARSLGTAPKPYGEILKLLGHRNDDLRSAAVRILARAGRSGTTGVLSRLGKRDRRTRLAAAQTLGLMKKPPIDKLVEKLSHKQERTRRGASQALGYCGAKAAKAVPALLKTLNDPDPMVRAAAAIALGKIKSDPKTITARLIRGLGDGDADARTGFVWGLAYISPKDVLEKMGTLDARGFEEGLHSLTTVGGDLAPLLLAAAAGKDATVRRAAVATVDRLDTKRKTAELATVIANGLRDDDAGVRATAAYAFAYYPPKPMTPHLGALAKLLGDPDPFVRADALLSIGYYKPSDQSVPATIERLCKDPDRFVAAAALSARWRMLGGDVDRSRAALHGVLADTAQPARSRVQAARELGWLRHRASPTLPTLRRVIENEAEPVELRVAAVLATGDVLRYRPGTFSLRARRVARAPAKVQQAVARALDWLAAKQVAHKDGGGRWNAQGPDGGRATYDPGVSALATLAFLGAGHTDVSKGPHREIVRDALTYLAGQIYDQSLHKRSRALVQYAWVTQVLCEALLTTGDRRYQERIGKALKYLADARRPYSGWKYTPRPGQCDTHCTARMMMTLRIGKLAGFPVDDEAFLCGMQWIDKMTDPNFGQVGYDYPGGIVFRWKGKHADRFPPERTQALTAAGAHARIMAGEEPRTSELIKKGTNLCIELWPKWQDEHRDMYYWYWGTLLTHQVGGAPWRKWEITLHAALLDSQDADGSWPPAGAWGEEAGRVYSTAIATLALLAPYMYARAFHTEPERVPPYDDSLALLRKLEQGRHDWLRRAAKGALRTAARR